MLNEVIYNLRMMMTFDIQFLKWLNTYIGSNPNFDAFVMYLISADLLKMAPLVLVLLGFWFLKDTNTNLRREKIVYILLGCFFAMAWTRFMVIALTFRARPLHNTLLNLKIPNGMRLTDFDGMSSFPSDHAALVFALAAGIFLLHKRWGIWALLHATLFVSLPRCYLSIHYPTDILMGGFIGIISVGHLVLFLKPKLISNLVLKFESMYPHIFYVLFLLLASEMMHVFNGIRSVADIFLFYLKLI